MTTVDIDDPTLCHERSGHGPAMLLVHGMCGDADVWDGQAHHLSARYTCVRCDRRGHAAAAATPRSASPGSPTMRPRASGPSTPPRSLDG